MTAIAQTPSASTRIEIPAHITIKTQPTIIGHVGRDPEHKLTKAKDYEVKNWNIAATGEAGPDEEMAEGMAGWDHHFIQGSPRDYVTFSVCEQLDVTETPSAQERGVRTTGKKWWNVVCWNPNTVRMIHTVGVGDKVEIRGHVKTYEWNGKRREQFELTGLCVLKRSSRRPVPEIH